MDRLWAPWRIDYVTKKNKGNCIFCKAYRDNKDKDNLIFYRSKYCFALLNLFPYNNGHTMIVPNRHVGEPDKLRDEEFLDIIHTKIKVLSILKKVLKPNGFNIGINIGKDAGAGIKNHLHIHIVPRWAGDTNFMPVIFNTKIISQSLEELYKKLITL
ncbi:MAG: HIT domain-containing protein [Candidatus Omnitrophica bacterium]|nr:HIT domain-containing protein [Candidatus Omnitrophota bacterium]